MSAYLEQLLAEVRILSAGISTESDRAFVIERLKKYMENHTENTYACGLAADAIATLENLGKRYSVSAKAMDELLSAAESRDLWSKDPIKKTTARIRLLLSVKTAKADIR